MRPEQRKQLVIKIRSIGIMKAPGNPGAFIMPIYVYSTKYRRLEITRCDLFCASYIILVRNDDAAIHEEKTLY